MNLADTLLPLVLGLGTGLALIIAIGSQNAFVLRIGIAGDNRTVAAAVAVCAASDAVLIFAGIVGIGVLVDRAPAALTVVQIVGAAFLLGYGLFALFRVWKPRALLADGSTVRVSTRTAVLTTVALTWLNPHVYLDTLIFLGSVANQQGETERWWWGAGAITASFIWFISLGFGARLLRPFFARPGSWRVLDALIAAVMLTLGVRMAVGIN